MFFKKKSTIYPSSWVEIDLNAIKYNLNQLKKFSLKNKFLVPSRNEKIKKIFTKPGILPVIKSQAYGHGMEESAKLLEKEKVECLGVFSVKEGARLREIGIKLPILLLESSEEFNIPAIVENNLMPTVGTLHFAELLNAYAFNNKKRVKVHVKVDTGMGRLGVAYDYAFEFIKEIFKFKNLICYGIYTHFPVADTNKKFTQGQIKKLYDLVVELDKTGKIIPFIHASNSMGLAGYRTNVLNLSRPGLMLYGMYPHPSLKKIVKIIPVMSVKSKVSFTKTIKKGNGVSYGHTFKAKKDTPIAIVPIGYSDGYLRSFSNKAFVLIKGKLCRVIGNVTMNQIIVDVSGFKDVKIGDTVTLLGQQGKKIISADELACYANTINYEITCSFGRSLPRIYIKN